MSRPIPINILNGRRRARAVAKAHATCTALILGHGTDPCADAHEYRNEHHPLSSHGEADASDDRDGEKSPATS